MSEDALIRREQRGNISVLTMVYRPYNLLGPKLINAIVEQVEEAQKAGSRAIVLRSGLRHFSAGADLDIFDKRVEQGSGNSSSENRRLNGVEFLRFMELLPIPLIASIHGVCLGGGLELALSCDYIIAASSAKIGSVEATLGLHPLLGGIQRQVQRIGALRAKEMSMLARRYENFQPRPHPATADRRLPFDCIALLLQGGGALGAYQGGVYEALAEANIHPDWIAGISIGAINAAIIAGNPPNTRVRAASRVLDASNVGRPVAIVGHAVHRFDEHRSHAQFPQSGECELCSGLWRKRILFCAATGAMVASGWNACGNEHLRH